MLRGRWSDRMDSTELTRLVKSRARDAGFHRVGIARAEQVDASHRFRAWLEAGRHGEMAYMEDHLERRLDPRLLFPGARSVVSVALNYYAPHAGTGEAGRGIISRFARGDDYHDILKDRLYLVLRSLEAEVEGLEGKCCVDTAPVAEKYWAARSGVGWIGKHTNLVTRDLGSWVFLGELILNMDLVCDTPMQDFCGTCNRCVDACPTGALRAPYQLDATRCIAYWTIEYRGEGFPETITQRLDDRVFGCDACQDVCPWNRKCAVPTDVEAFSPRVENMDQPLETLLEMDEETFRRRFRNSPVKRPKWKGFLRNVLHALARIVHE